VLTYALRRIIATIPIMAIVALVTGLNVASQLHEEMSLFLRR